MTIVSRPYSKIGRENYDKIFNKKEKQKQMRIYLAGPMRGLPYLNFPAFYAAAALLRAAGHQVFNPAERDTKEFGEINCPNGSMEEFEKVTGLDPLAAARNCFLADTHYICKYADAIALLPGWENSKGAKAEYALADAIGLSIIRLGNNGK